jgi:aminopeptidase-like protein
MSPTSDGTAAPVEGTYMHSLATRLFQICRSITGDGVRETLGILAEELPGLVIHEVPSGTQVLDWTVPDEWNIRGAYLEGPDGSRILDFRDSNLHVMSYSIPIDTTLSLEELQPHLHSDPDLPDAIPYVTGYYSRSWGLCLTQRERDRLTPGEYRVVIDSTLEPGSLTYGELVIPGALEDEIFVSTYICHPSLANNELSGPVVATALARWVRSLPQRQYTYRFVFVPETIGAITLLSRSMEHLKSHVVAGFNLTCIGDDGDYSYLASRDGNLPIDRIAARVVAATPRPVVYSYLDRGSDERHYGSAGVDLPVISLMRTKYGVYPEYHTSLDDLTVITPSGLQGGLDLVRDCIRELESTTYYRTTVLAEAQLGRRGLYHSVHARTVADEVLMRTHLMAYADGTRSARDMAELLSITPDYAQELIDELSHHDLLTPTPLRRNP